MRIKTNQERLNGAVLLLGTLLEHNKPQDISEKLIHGMVFKVYQKIRNKAEMPGKNGYSFSLSDQDALALFIFINQTDLMVDFYPYEALHLESIANEIHKKYVRQ